MSDRILSCARSWRDWRFTTILAHPVRRVLRSRTWVDDQGIELIQLAETVGSHNSSNTVSEEVWHVP